MMTSFHWIAELRRGTLPVAAFSLLLAAVPAHGQQPPLLPVDIVGGIARELSGESAQRMIESLSLHHRMRGSVGFNAASSSGP